jgi:hypothetical protein
MDAHVHDVWPGPWYTTCLFVYATGPERVRLFSFVVWDGGVSCSTALVG